MERVSSCIKINKYKPVELHKCLELKQRATKRFFFFWKCGSMRVCLHVYTSMHAYTRTHVHTQREARTLAFTHIWNSFAQQSNLCIQIIHTVQHIDFCTHQISFYWPTTKIIISLYLSNAAVFSFRSSGSSFFMLHIKFYSLSLPIFATHLRISCLSLLITCCKV